MFPGGWLGVASVCSVPVLCFKVLRGIVNNDRGFAADLQGFVGLCALYNSLERNSLHIKHFRAKTAVP